MRGKRATMLRRYAEDLSRDQSEVEYDDVLHSAGQKTIVLKPCVKKAYRRLKDFYKSGVLGVANV